MMRPPANEHLDYGLVMTCASYGVPHLNTTVLLPYMLLWLLVEL
jgi:hypothetical protein